jgi:hypothetical protein
MGVRKLPLSVAVSLAVHGGVVAWMGTRAWAQLDRPAPRAAPTIEIVAVTRPAAEPAPIPLEVALVDELAQPPPAGDAPRPAAAAVARSIGARDPAPAMRAPAITAPGAGSATERTPRPPGRDSSVLAMRRAGAPSVALPAGRWDALDRAPRGSAPERDLSTGQLRESGRGDRTSNQGAFVATVNPDGSVQLTDSPNFHVHFELPSVQGIGNGLSAWYGGSKGASGEDSDATLAKQIQAVAGSTTDPDDRSKTVVVPVISGGFDATDALMRGQGIDPYASKKLKFLDSTRDERVQLGTRHRDQQLRQATQLVRRNLDALRAANLGLAARKQALFELWDECVEAGDPSLVIAGAAARRMVIGFIRAHLPAGSPDAFTAEELAVLGRARQSRAAFSPYE